MPFYEDWNPNKGGSFINGANWVVTHLGKRRKKSKTSLHIIDHCKGFVPGNLEWATHRKQTAEQMFKIIMRLKHENKQLKERLKEATGC